MKNVYCMNCGIIKEYKIIKSPHDFDGEDFKYSECKCGSQQPLCLGASCIDVIESSCPQNENKKCLEIIGSK